MLYSAIVFCAKLFNPNQVNLYDICLLIDWIYQYDILSMSVRHGITIESNFVTFKILNSYLNHKGNSNYLTDFFCVIDLAMH